MPLKITIELPDDVVMEQAWFFGQSSEESIESATQIGLAIVIAMMKACDGDKNEMAGARRRSDTRLLKLAATHFAHASAV